MSVNPIPEGYNSVTVHLFVSDAAAHLAFIQQAFDGEPMEHVKGPDGRVMHAALRIGNSMLMLGEGEPGQALSRVTLYIYTTAGSSSRRISTGAGSIP